MVSPKDRGAENGRFKVFFNYFLIVFLYFFCGSEGFLGMFIITIIYYLFFLVVQRVL